MLDDGKQVGGPVKGIIGHLEDLRSVLFWSMLSIVVGMIIAAQFAPHALRILAIPLQKTGRDPATFLRTMTVTGAMDVALLAIFWGGLLVSLPAITVIVGRYGMAALSKRERHAVLIFSSMAVVMFFAGVATAFFGVLPRSLEVMFWFNGWMGITIEFITATDYIAFTLIILVIFGAMFELPVILLILGHLGLVTSTRLRAIRRYVIVGLLVLAMVLTPTTDPFTQLVLAVPLAVLYELCIVIIWIRERRAAH